MKARTERQGITDDPLTCVLKLCRQQQMSAGKYITGRWQRIPRELRVCNYVVGGVQAEYHALTTCGHCSHIRNFLNINSKNIHLIMDHPHVCKYIYDCLRQ